MGWIDRVSDLLGRIEKNFKDCDAFYQGLIDEHLDLDRSKSEQDDILDVLLQIWRDREFQVDLTLEHIKGVLMNVFSGGIETSAATVIWAMTLLMKNPRWSAVYVGMQYLTKLVFVNAWAIGRDPEAWENPEEFYPERFIGSSNDVKGLDFGLIPFGAGRRGCPGIHMGLATVELVLANLLYKFEWEMPIGMNKDDLDFDVIPGVTKHKKNSLYLVAKTINA
ncbi:hypothetical protein PTKIN_Ptkin16aG0035400 [Pterospermum kingtungense]